jgi:hypothetical protein
VTAERIAACAQAARTAATAWEHHDRETLLAIDNAYEWPEFYAGLLSAIGTLRRSWALSADVAVAEIDAKVRAAYRDAQGSTAGIRSRPNEPSTAPSTAPTGEPR